MLPLSGSACVSCMPCTCSTPPAPSSGREQLQGMQFELIQHAVCHSGSHSLTGTLESLGRRRSGVLIQCGA